MTTDVFVAGDRGLLGSALVRALTASGRDLVLTADGFDLRDGSAVRAFFRAARPGTVYLAAARVGGIAANMSRPWDFVADNLEIQSAVLGAALSFGCRRLIVFGSSCIYPAAAPQPLRPESLMAGPLEPTNRAYATAKLALVEMARALRAQHGLAVTVVIPCNLYGPNDRYGEGAHVIPMLMERMYDAKMSRSATCTIWGTGRPRREFLHADDVARAALLVEQHPELDSVNVGAGTDLPIKQLAYMIADAVDYSGELEFDAARPDGVASKLLDCGPITELGFRRQISLDRGLRETYLDFHHRKQAGTLR